MFGTLKFGCRVSARPPAAENRPDWSLQTIFKIQIWLVLDFMKNDVLALPMQLILVSCGFLLLSPSGLNIVMNEGYVLPQCTHLAVILLCTASQGYHLLINPSAAKDGCHLQ